MHPVLFSLGPITLHTYGLMIALGFFTGMWVILREGQIGHLSKEFMMDAGMWAVFAGLAGARVLYVITRWQEYVQYPWEVFYIWKGGLVWYGGFIGAVTVLLWFCRKHKVPPMKFLDAAVTGTALGNGIGRLGCLAAGCCYGRPAELPWSITFTDPQSIAPLHTPLHPTQLYLFVSDSLLCLVLIGCRRLFKGNKKDARFESRHGMVFACYLMFYAIGRGIIEIYRGDSIRGFVFGEVSTSQFIGFFLFLAGLILFLTVYQRSKKTLSTQKVKP